MRVVVTGGTGLIGSALAQSLGQDGHEVVILSRNPRQAGPMPETVTFQKWDGLSTGSWVQALEGADAVVHLAGASIAGDDFLPARWTRERKKLIIDSRVKSGKALVEALQTVSKKPRIFVQSSAVGYYGVHNDGKDITEESPAGNDFLADVCKQWEASTADVEEMGLRRIIIRTGVVLDKDEGALPRLVLPFKLFAGGPLGSGKQPFPWIHLDDEVGAIRFLMADGRASGPFNLSAPNPLTNAQFARVLGKVLGRPSFVPAPGFAFNMAFGEVATVVVDGQKALPKRLLDMGYKFKFPTAEEALKDIFTPEKRLATV
ncbi:MAG: TIGR01777 family oxidoreductase [Anaerolineae bacterium]